MAFDIVLFLLAAWVLYCVARVMTAPCNAIEVGANVPALCPVAFAFQTYMGVREFYLELNPGHKKYVMHGTSLTPETIIEVWEEAGFQLVKHQYRVVELVPRERMKLVSEAGQVRVLGLFRGKTRSEVEFRFNPMGESQCSLGLTICIVFPNKLRHLLARLFFTEEIWRRHARQEMYALARLIERRYVQKIA
ncbi:MAG: hypothetical protein AB1768_06525 [Pseudomonadota bacterium]